MAAMFIAALCISSCDHNNGEGGNGGGGNGGGSNHEYPATADVIPKAVKDIDGNWYDAVRIGNQIWMAENLKTTRYADGTTIPLNEGGSLTEPCRYYPDGSENSVQDYGYLYNWPAVMHGAESSETNPSGVQGICPKGWHVPSHAEWVQLRTYCKSTNEYTCNDNNENIAKALAADHDWEACIETSIIECRIGYNLSANNATGFSALPAGFVHPSYGTDFNDEFGSATYFWSTSTCPMTTGSGIPVYDDAWILYLSSCDTYITIDAMEKDRGISVRCVKD